MTGKLSVLSAAFLSAVCGAALLFSAPAWSQESTIEVGRELCDDCVAGEAPDVSTGSFTVGARVNFIEPGNEKGNNDDKLGMLFAVASGWTEGFRVLYDWRNNRLSFHVGGEHVEGCTSSIGFHPGVMHDVVAVCDGDAKLLLLYVDGELAASSPHNNPLVTNDQPLKVGFVGMGVGSSKMYVDKVEYWARALSQTEVEERNVARPNEEIVINDILKRVASTSANASNVDDLNLANALDFNLPEDVKTTVRNCERERFLFLNDVEKAAPLVFDEAERLVKSAPQASDVAGKDPTNSELDVYGSMISELKRIAANSRKNADRARRLTLQLQAAYPREASVFAKIDALEASADRVRKIEQDALATYKSVVNRLTAATSRARIYVSTGGNDETGTGAKNAPFASLNRAFAEIAKKQGAEKQAQGGKKSAAVIELAGGVYRATSTATLANAENVLVKAAQGSKAEIAGGRVVNNFESLSEAASKSEEVAKAQDRFHPEVRDKIFVANLGSLGFADFGKLASRGYGVQDKVNPIPSLYVQGESQTLARWPNDGEETLKFGEKVETPDDEKTSTFKYDYDRPSTWKDLDDIWAFGLFEWEWAANQRKVTKLDVDKKEVTFDYPKGSGKFDYYYINVLEELDVPGEYYVDPRFGLLYFYPPQEIATKEALNGAKVEYDEFSERFFDLENCKNVVVKDLAFRCGRESVAKLTNCERCYVDGCTLEQLGGNAVIIANGANCGVLNCRLRELGAGGLRISGGNRETLAQCKHIVYNNFISDFSRIDRVYAPAVHAEGCGVAIVNNLMCDCPHHAMRTDGNDMYVARNEIHSCVYEYSDQAGIDIYCDPSYRGIVIEKNLWRHIGSAFALCGQAGIRLDDSISGVIMLDNVFYRSSGGFFGGIQIHGGKDNLCRGNLFVDCKQAFSFSPWNEGRFQKFVEEQFPQHVKNEKYLAAYPFFNELFDHVNRNYIIDNDAVNCGTFNQNGDGLEVFAGNRSRTAAPDLTNIGVRGDFESYGDAFYANPAAMRSWLEQLAGRSLSDIGLKGKWNGANVDVSPKFIGGAGAQKE